MNVKSAPAAFDRIEMFPVKRYAGTDYFHVVFPFSREPLAGTVRDAVFLFQQDLLFKQEIDHLLVRAEFITERVYHFLKKIPECLFP